MLMADGKKSQAGGKRVAKKDSLLVIMLPFQLCALDFLSSN